MDIWMLSRAREGGGSVSAEDFAAEVEEGEDREGGEPAGEDKVLGVAEEVEAGGFAEGSVEEDVFDEEPGWREEGPQAEEPGLGGAAVGWGGLVVAGVGFFAEPVEGLG